MNRKIALLLSIILCLSMLTACGKKAAVSSSVPQAAASSSVPVQSSSKAAVSSSTVSSTSAGASSSSATLTDGSVQSLTLWYGEGGTKHATVSMKLPKDWTVSDSTVVGPDGIKRMEFATLHENADPADPFPATLTNDYATGGGMQYPEGYGFQRLIAKEINGNPFQMYIYKTWPDDSDKAWFPHYTFYAINGCVLQVHFFSFTETDEDALFYEILGSLKLEL
ncbi:MAG: hypothetical protein RR284_03915 [Ruthenibacterium sp.]